MPHPLFLFVKAIEKIKIMHFLVFLSGSFEDMGIFRLIFVLLFPEKASWLY